ncbi:MAG: glycerophosphodiester phosphodiesterase family protein [Bacteroidales bacterium]
MKKILAFPLLCLSLSLAAQTRDPGFSFVGHRGASYLAPENTLASMKLAWELGADGAECDIMLSSDKQVLLFHDANTKKLTGEDHVVADTPWPVLKDLPVILRETNRDTYTGETIPLLSDVLDALPEDRLLVIEIKTGPEILPFLQEVLEQHWTRGRITFIAFDLETILAAKSLYPDIPAYHLSMFGADVKKNLRTLREHGIDGVDLRHGIIDGKMMARCREAGMDVWCWTVNDVETARQMKALGVSAVTTDRPAWLKENL